MVDAALEGFVGLPGDESFVEDVVAVNKVGDEVRDIGLNAYAVARFRGCIRMKTNIVAKFPGS